jgi:glycosyltransferase involved in cell wall biosynthesis
MSRRLELLFVCPYPPSPATFGAQRRMEGLMAALSRRHRITCASLLWSEYDPAATRRAMKAYCDEVILVPMPPRGNTVKRLFQVGAPAWLRSFERHWFTWPAFQLALDGLLRSQRFDFVNIEFPVMASYRLRQSPAGTPLPRLIIDSHNIEHDLARKSGQTGSLPRRVYQSYNWRFLLREELAAWGDADGVAFTSKADADRAVSLLPKLQTRTRVIPNGVDVDYFQPRPPLPPPDGRTLLFFGTMNYFPNLDGMRYFLDEVWPIIERARPDVRLKIVGPNPAPEILARRGPRIEVAGLVDDLRPHLSSAAASIVPLRVGGGTRLKIVEAMGMAKAIVSTTLGAEGIDVTSGRDILIADTPQDFADAVCRVIDQPELARQLGAAARELAEKKYSWAAVAGDLERFMLELQPVPAAASPLADARV